MLDEPLARIEFYERLDRLHRRIEVIPMDQVVAYFRRAWHIWQTQGWTALRDRIHVHSARLLGRDSAGIYDSGYDNIRQHYRWNEERLRWAATEMATLTIQPTFSILIPVYKVDVTLLDQMVQSVCDQIYPGWQLCLVDDASDSPEIEAAMNRWASTDGRIHVHFSEQNLGIAGATSIALSMAKGEFVVMMDHDDLVDPGALLLNTMEINNNPQLDLIYSDEDKLRADGKRHSPYFKPDFSPELLESQNYIGHLVAARRSLVEQVGGFRGGFDGAQDYDLLLRLTERTNQIAHIPQVLYSWREIPGSTAMGHQEKDYAWDAGVAALRSRCERLGITADVQRGALPGTYSMLRAIAGNPMVSIVIPFRDQADLLDNCLTSLLENSLWPDLEIIGVNNGSKDTKTHKRIQYWQQQDSRVRFIQHDQPFNFSELCNVGVAAAKGHYVVLMNNDIEITQTDWIEKMLSYAQRREIGAVGCKLVYRDSRIQHAGLVIGIGQSAGHVFKRFAGSLNGYFCRLKIVSNVSAVTAAMMMVDKNKYEEVGGLDETAFSIAYNDVDFCLKLNKSGYRNVQNNEVQAIHHESASRGKDNSGEKQKRHDREAQILRQRWGSVFQQGDPFYNSNLTLDHEDYSLRQQ